MPADMNPLITQVTQNEADVQNACRCHVATKQHENEADTGNDEAALAHFENIIQDFRVAMMFDMWKPVDEPSGALFSIQGAMFNIAMPNILAQCPRKITEESPEEYVY